MSCSDKYQTLINVSLKYCIYYKCMFVPSHTNNLIVHALVKRPLKHDFAL